MNSMRLEDYRKSRDTIALERFFADVLKQDKRTSDYVEAVISPTEEDIKRSQRRADISSIAGGITAKIIGLGWESKLVPAVSIIFKSCPIEYARFENTDSHMEGKWMFRVPFDRDSFYVPYRSQKGEEKKWEMRMGHEWGVDFRAKGKRFFGGGEVEGLEIDPASIFTQAQALGFLRRHIPGFLSIKSDQKLCEDLLNLFEADLLYMSPQFGVRYEKSKDRLLGRIEFKFKNGLGSWRKAFEKHEVLKNKTANDVVSSFFGISNRLLAYVKEDFRKLRIDAEGNLLIQQLEEKTCRE
jgi:hypothetical protein